MPVAPTRLAPGLSHTCRWPAEGGGVVSRRISGKELHLQRLIGRIKVKWCGEVWNVADPEERFGMLQVQKLISSLSQATFSSLGSHSLPISVSELTSCD